MSTEIHNVFSSKEEQLEYLKSKRAMLSKLSQAIEKYLCFDLDIAIERISKGPKFTPEMLVDAMAEVGKWEKRLDMSRKQLEEIESKEQDGFQCEGLIDIIQEMSISPAEHNLEHAKEWLVTVQEGLDKLNRQKESWLESKKKETGV